MCKNTKNELKKIVFIWSLKLQNKELFLMVCFYKKKGKLYITKGHTYKGHTYKADSIDSVITQLCFKIIKLWCSNSLLINLTGHFL